MTKRSAAERRDRFLFKRRLISVAVMSAVSSHAGANPTGPQVVNGQVSVATQGSVLTVTNTPNAIVNWHSFSIGSNETTRFVQQSAASAVLNRVVGVDPSVILGTLQSNGKVFLINTNGILFGQGARVDVAGLVASTLNLNDADFLAGRLNFDSGPLSGGVVNRGTIATPEGGSVFLVGTAVENNGIIHAPGGEVILAAGQSVRLGSTGAPNVLVEVQAPANQAVNLGEIAVGAGKAGIYGGFVEQKGIVSADTATVNAAGKIVFKATRDTTLAAGSSTSANGGQGGTLAVQSGGTTRVEGAVSATGASGKGGTIRLLGTQVGVAGGASVDVSGAAGGGTLLVGGDYKGGNPEVINARATFVAAGTHLRADATVAGDGGRIIVWSDEVTHAYGNISARGGPLGGDGGFVETSSHGFLSILDAPDLAAPLGRGGTWLLDPYNITVVAAGAGSQILDPLSPSFLANANSSTVSNAAIQNALNAGGVVIVDTGGSGAGTQAGDITVDAPIAMTGGMPATLELRAANNITLTGNAHITSTGILDLVLIANQDGDGGPAGGGNAVLQPGSSVFTAGGAVTITGTNVSIDSQIGSLAQPLAGSVLVQARNDLDIGCNAFSQIASAGASMTLIADMDGDGAGNLTVGGAGAFVELNVVQADSPVAPSMELRGYDIVFQEAQSVTLTGGGTQTIVAERDVRMSNSGTGFLTVGAETLTDLRAGRDLTIESLGDGAAVLSGPYPDVGAKRIEVAGDILMRNSGFANSEASILTVSGAGQTITARSLRMVGAAGAGQSVFILNQSGTQSVTTTGDGPTGWGIHLINNGSLDSFNNGVFINSDGALQQITATNGSGILFDGTGGPIDVWTPGTQTILLDGVGGNALELRGGPGETIVNSGTQSITAGSGANAGSITIRGGSTLNSSASIFSSSGSQTVSTTGLLRLVAGSGPDDLQPNFLCDLHACANLGQTLAGAAQIITAGSIVIEGGTGGARNEANIFSFGPQTVAAPGGITIIGGAGAGPGNWASLAVAGGNPFAQSIDFGAGGLTIRVSPTGGEGSNANVYSDGTQTLTGTGDITLVGGRAGARVWSEINGQRAQSVTARSISITAEAGPSSTGIFTPNGPQSITTTGGIGGNPANYGLSIRNLGATGTDQNGFGAAAYITGRVGSQTIAVTGSRGILLEGVGGVAVIDGTGTAQSVSSTGAIDLKAGAGAAVINFASGASQEISAGSITLTGGTADGAAAIIEAFNGTQSITAAGALTLTAGTAPGPAIPDLSDPPPLCGAVAACAVARAHGGLQTISAGSISMTGGSAGTENLVSIRGDAGQDISIGSGGLVMQGGAGAGLRNFAVIESYANDQILRFAVGAPLRLTGGTEGSKHFAAISAIATTTTQQILGKPVITLTGGASGGGDGTGYFLTYKGNNAAIVTEPGTVTGQFINAQSVDLQGGNGIDNNAIIGSFGTGAQSITVAGDVRLRGGTVAGTHAQFLAFADQSISADSIEMLASGGGTAVLYADGGGQQEIVTTGQGLNGWGIQLTNNGTVDGQPVYISSSGAQHIQALDGDGILLDAITGAVEMRANGVQSLAIDGAASANALLVRATAGRAEIHAQSQSIVAGNTGPGSITLQGGTANYAQAFVFADAGAQTISTTGLLSIVAGSAPDLGQPPLNCGLGGACSLIGNVFEGSDPTVPIQTITALGGLSIVGGSTGAHNDTGIFSRGSEVINAPGGITLQAGGGGPNNFATIAMDRAGYFQSVDFGAGGLTILANAAGANGNYAEIYSSGTQTITGTGDIRLDGGVAGGRSWAHITGIQGQDITARSVSVTARTGPESIYLYNETGTQRIRTTGGEGGDPTGFGITLRNLGASGVNHSGFQAAASITTRSGVQILDVANSAGLRVLGDGGYAVISSGQFEPPAGDYQGVSQTITVHGTGANAIIVDAGAGRAQLYSYSTASQTIAGGLAGEQGSISVLGGTATGATGNITADTGTQTLVTSGMLTVTGGTAPQIAPLNFDQADCLPACASVYAGAGLQTLDADAIVIQGGASGSENLASVYGKLGQAVTVRGAGGLSILGGGASGTITDHSNFAILENYGGTQLITFLAAGAPLTLDAGDRGQRHFAGLYNGGIATTGQQIIGNPVVTIAAGAGGSGAGSPDRFQLSSNFAFIASESGAQHIAATSITVRAGGTDSNTADIVNWGGNLSGSLLGSQTIATLAGLTLEGGAGNNANARVYSHSGGQAIDVGGALTTRRTGAGDVFLGNVFDPAATNIGINAVDISVAGGLQLQGGNLWGDDGITLHLANGGSATGGTIHAGRASAPTNGGDIVVDPGTFVTLNGSLTLDGTAAVGTTGLLELVGGTLTVANGIANSGTLRLRTSSLDAPAVLQVSGGQLVNAAGAVLQSLTAGGTSANTITATVLNQGTIAVEHALTIDNTGTLFDTASGALDVATGSVLTANGGRVRIGSGTDFGARTGTLDVAGNAVLEIASDVTLPAFRGQLGLSGTVHVTGLVPVALTNQGILDLSFDTLDSTVTLVNAGELKLFHTGGDGVLQNLFDATAEATGSNTLAGLSQAGLLRISGSDVIGGGQLNVAAASLTNSGEIDLETSANGFGGALVVGGGTGQLINTGTVRSLGLGASGNNVLYAAVDNQEAIEVQRSLTVSNSALFDTSVGVLEIATGETLSVVSGTVRIGGGTDLGTGEGRLDVGGIATLQLASDLTVGGPGAQLGLSGNVIITAAAPANLVNLRTLDLQNDTLAAPVTLINAGTVTLLQTNGDGTLENTTSGTVAAIGSNTLGGLIQAGLLRISGSDAIGAGQLVVNAPVTNSGTIELETSLNGFGAALALTGQTLTNTGSVRSLSQAATGNNNLLSEFVNQGLLDVQASLFINAPLATGNAGTINIANGATLSLNHAYTNTSSGVIQGSGTLSLQGLTLTNAGRLSPGDSLGTLSIDGNLVLTPSSVLDIELDGTGAGQYDAVTVSGTATLDGTLNVLFPSLYQGQVGDSFQVLTAAAVSGTFASVTLPATRSGSVAYSPNDAVLDLQGMLNRWIGLSGLWTVAGNWSLNEVPTASHDVQIDVAGSLETITIPTGSTLDINSLVLSDNLSINASTLNLTEDLIINAGATLQLIDAHVGGAGAVRNHGAILVLPGTGSTIARIASSTGQIQVQSNTTTLGQLLVANGFTNDGTIRFTAGGINSGLGVTTGALVNRGTIISEGTSNSANRLAGAVTNIGTIQVDEDLRVDNVGLTFTQGPAGDLNIAAGQLLFLNGGTLDLQGAMSVDAGASMRLGGVTVNGPATLQNQGTLILDSFNTINAALNNQGQIDIPVGTNQLNGAFTQSGTVNLLSSGLDGAVLNVQNAFANDGTIVLDTASTGIQPRLTVANGTLTNNGTIRSQASGGTGPTEIDAQIVNTGTIDVDHSLALIGNVGRVFDSAGGTLDIGLGNVLSVNGGRTRIGTATMGASQGALRLQSPSHVLDLAGNVTLPAGGWQLDLSNGLVTIDSSVGGGVTLTNLGTLDLGGDVIAPNVALVNQGTLTVPGGSGATVQGALVQAGTVQLLASAAGNAFFTAANAFTNTGTVDLQAGPTGSVSQFTVTNGVLTNAASGVIRSTTTGGTGANLLNADLVNAGLIDATHDLAISGALTIPNTATGTVVTGAGNLTLGGAFTVNANGGPVTIGGTGALATSAASTVNGGQLHLDTRRWNNSGAMSIDGRVTFDNGAVLTNVEGATLALTGTNASPIAQGVGALGVVSNAGTLSKTGAAVQTIQTTLNNSGTVNVDTGVLELAAGGTHSGRFAVDAAGAELSFTGGTHAFGSAAFSGPGLVRVNGAMLDIAAPSVVSNAFTLQAGGIAGTGDLTLTGPFTLSGGTVSGTGVLVTRGATTENNGTALLDGRTWRNFGALVVNGRINLDNGATLANEPGASIELAAGGANGQPLLWDGTGAMPVLNNRGILTKNAAADQRVNVTVANSGKLNVNSGTLTVAAFAAGTNNGDISIATGTTLSTDGLALTNSATGTISGTGTVDLGGATLTNAGTLRPGASPGTLSIVGDLALTASSVVAMEIEGTAAGQFDVIDVSGDATLAGTLNVTLPGAYRGGVSDTFAVISAASTSGAFATIDAPTYMTLLPGYGATDLTLSIDALSNRWSALSGLWTLGSNWALGRAPASREDVFIDSGAAVVVPDGTSLDVRSLTVSGGRLELQGGATIVSAGSIANESGGELRINGATVNTGVLANAGTVTLQSGALSAGEVRNSGTFTINGGSFTRSAGAGFGNAGTVNLNAGTLTLDQGHPTVGGGTFALKPGTTLKVTGGTHTLSAINGRGIVEVEGTSSRAELYSGTTMKISAQTLKVQGGAFAASVDPPELTLDVPGGVTLKGGAAAGASASIQGSSVNLTTSAITLTGGTGSGSYAGIQAVAGAATIIVDGAIDMSPGTGPYAHAIISATGPLNVVAASCDGCNILATDPFLSPTPQTGLFGKPVKRPPSALQVPSSVIVGVQTAQMGGEGNAVLVEQEEEEAEQEQSADPARAQEEQKNEKPLQVCM